MDGSTLEAQPTGGTSEDIGAPFASLINPFFRFYTKILTYSRLISCFKISIFRNASVKKSPSLRLCKTGFILVLQRMQTENLSILLILIFTMAKILSSHLLLNLFRLILGIIIIYAMRRNNSSFFTFVCSSIKFLEHR